MTRSPTGRAGPPAHLSGLSYEVGSSEPIAELPELVAAPGQLAYLHRNGLRDYSRADRPLAELVTRAARRSLATSGVGHADVGAIVYASSSYSPDQDVELIPRLALALDIPAAIPHGVFLANCANGCLALQRAVQLLALGEASAVLVIVADAVRPGGIRALADRTCVLGDAAASCVVTTEAPREGTGYRIDALEIAHHPDLVAIDRKNMAGELAFIRAVSAGVTAICSRVASRTTIRHEQHARLVTGNYTLSIINNYAELTGIDPTRLFRDNVARISHCFAADQLISLTDLQAETELAGQHVFVLASGVYVWAGMSMYRN